ncbi:MAG: DUF262 domain-containing protein [Bacteroidaceae bacterium]|nr:DUF262 domain-containing protein [Bacteroidaceae bacterium]
MVNKHTLCSLCDEYDKIEIPIIQRDYAQGREEQSDLRNRFVEYLVTAMEEGTCIELDFVYGNEREDVDKDGRTLLKTFIPIDGQQRLTTLWLLHWFLSVREAKLHDMRKVLSKFTYETRPATHDFCKYLINEEYPANSLLNIDSYIKNRNWFDPEWLNDGSINGMLRMLKTFSAYSSLTNGKVKLEQLLSPQNAISFYFVPLKQFGLSEELYIRMNARGKILTEFENFKSEFYKIVKSHPRLEEIKDKMEYDWVSHLWSYRKKKVFVTDECFMSFLCFVTRMLYFSQAKYRSEEGYEDDFTNFNLLRKIYFNNENVNFLIFAFDHIPLLSSFDDFSIIRVKEKKLSLSEILSMSIKGENMQIDQFVVLFSALSYLYKHRSVLGEITDSERHTFYDNLKDYVRIVRNLIVNTKDKSEREQPRILRSVIYLAENANVYAIVRKPGFNLEGLRDAQCIEENIKSKIIEKYPDAKPLIQRIEDDQHFYGNIMPILASVYTSREKEIDCYVVSDEDVDNFETKRLDAIYQTYKMLAQDDFHAIWGNMLNSSLYTHYKPDARLIFDEDYAKHPAVMALSVKYTDCKFDSLDEFLQNEEKKFVKRVSSKYSELKEVRDVKVQLYLLYILTIRVMQCDRSDFFANGWYNFGWLKKESGFTSLFDNGIEGDLRYSEVNPIFQTYNSQFRYSWGLNSEHSLPCEIVGNGRPQKPWEKLKEWATKQT